jgi:hypothetical protein
VAIAPWTHVFLAGHPRGRAAPPDTLGSSRCFRAGFLPFITDVSIASRGCGKYASLSRQSCELTRLA